MSAEWLIAFGVFTLSILLLFLVLCVCKERLVPDAFFGIRRRRDSLHRHRSALLHLASRNESLSFPRVPTHACTTSPPLPQLPVAPTHDPAPTVLETCV